MKKLLWVSPYVPYNQVKHAGGKTHNYYIKYFQKSGLFDIHLVTLAQRCEISYIDLKEYGISYQVAVIDGGIVKNVYRICYNMNSVFNSRHKLCQTILSYQYHELRKMVEQYSKDSVPDIVIMQWTGAAFLLPVIKRLFPQAYTVVIEEDVTFLGYERRYKTEKNPSKKKQYKRRYELVKKRELSLLGACDLVVVNNKKDRDLLETSGVPADKVYTTIPYYEDYSWIERRDIRPSIIYYGVMSREENHKAAMWLIQNVMPQFQDTDIELNIIGNCPQEELLKLETERIHVRGFVDNVSEYFSHALCMAIPLQLGAGIKVKILEGMSAGIPILTNSVGIEGIPAENGQEYYHCETVKEYVTMIRHLYVDVEERESISKKARLFMKNTYNIDECLGNLISRLLEER